MRKKGKDPAPRPMTPDFMRGVAEMFDETIEEMLADCDQWCRTPADAVEVAMTAHCVNVEMREPEGRPRVVLPLTVQRILVRTAQAFDESEEIPAVDLDLPLLIQRAARNMHTGQGQQRPFDWHFVKWLKDVVIPIWAQQQLHKRDVDTDETREQVAKEAAAMAFNASASTSDGVPLKTK